MRAQVEQRELNGMLLAGENCNQAFGVVRVVGEKPTELNERASKAGKLLGDSMIKGTLKGKRAQKRGGLQQFARVHEKLHM